MFWCSCSRLQLASRRRGRSCRRNVAGLDAAAQDAVVEKFVASKGGTPIVENQTRLIFLAKDKDGQTPRIVGDFNNWAMTQVGYDVLIGKPTRIEGTSWSFLESTSYTNARLEYVLFYDKDAVPDPLNRHTVQAFAGPRSEVRMPFFVAQPEVDELGSAPKGEVIAESFQSRSLGGSRRVWYYLPPGYSAATDTLYPVIYVLDGANYVEKMDVPKVLDHLIANKTDSAGDRGVFGARRSAGGIFAQSRNGGDSSPTSWCRRSTSASGRSRRRTIASSSAARSRPTARSISRSTAPSVFGLCAAIAPPVQTATVVSNQAAARAAVVSIKFFVMGGVYDSMIDGARRLHTTLDEYSAPVTLSRSLRRPQHQHVSSAPG